MRLGAVITATQEEIDEIIKGNDTKLIEVINRGIFMEGSSYIPDSEIEDYNKYYGTKYEVKDVEFYL